MRGSLMDDADPDRSSRCSCGSRVTLGVRVGVVGDLMRLAPPVSVPPDSWLTRDGGSREVRLAPPVSVPRDSWLTRDGGSRETVVSTRRAGVYGSVPASPSIPMS